LRSLIQMRHACRLTHYGNGGGDFGKIHLMDFGLAIWFLTLHGVNTAMYLAVTRVAHGWAKTLLGLAFFYGCVALAMTVVRCANVGPKVFAPCSYAFTFGCWLVVTVALSRRGTRPSSFFAAVLCGAHQLALGIVCHTLMARLRPQFLPTVIASVLMLSMGVVMVRLLLPRVRRLSQSVDWLLLDVVACILLALVYATGFWPTWVAGGSWREAMPFVLSVTALVSFFPVVFHLSEKCHDLARMALVEESVRLMVGEVAIHRAAIDAARRQRHDQRHHRIALAEYLLRGQVDKALRYLEQLDADAGETPTDKLIWCENDTINAILSGSARKAAALGIGFEVTANVERTVNLPDIDVVAFVANLIENAINAAGKSGADDRCREVGEAPRVTVALRQRELTFGMTVTNPVPAGFALSANGLPCEEPGVGLESVRRVIGRYHGELVYAVEDGVLECQALMKMEND